MLPNRESVGEHLARVKQIRQPIDHKHSRVLREPLQLGVRKRADHDPVNIARQTETRDQARALIHVVAPAKAAMDSS
jgi:hypothetical protein